MGIVFASNKGLIRNFAEEVSPFRTALVEPGKERVDIKLAGLTGEEAEVALLKLDQMAYSRNHEGIAVMLTEEAASILAAIRLVKTETKQPFQGILGVGGNLDLQWLRPKHVGETTLLNLDATAGLGLYQGANGAIYTWLAPVVANTWASLIPSQKMVEEAAVVHLGAIDPIDVPKIGGVEFQLSGIPVPVQSTNFNIRRGLGSYGELPFVRFEKPVLVGPEKTQRVRLMPNITGDTKFELMSILIAKAESLTG